MTVGYHAPLPPAPTGVADYASALLAALRPRCQVALDAAHADVHLYQLGNNPLHREIHDRAQARPGVVLLHDASLHHFYLGTLGREAYIERFASEYGVWARGLAKTLWENRSRSAADPRYFEYGMLGEVVTRARAVIVHNEHSASLARRAGAAAAAVHVIPHLLLPMPAVPQLDVERLRIERGWQGRFVFGVFGHLRESKRLASILRAFHQARQTHSRLHVLLCGEPLPTGLPSEVETLPMLPPREWQRTALAVDACLNLRYPSCGETSGIGIRMRQAGKPVLVTAPASEPEGSVIPIEPGAAEEHAIAHWMRLLAERPDLAREIGEQGRRHVLIHNEPDGVAACFVDVLRATMRG